MARRNRRRRRRARVAEAEPSGNPEGMSTGAKVLIGAGVLAALIWGATKVFGKAPAQVGPAPAQQAQQVTKTQQASSPGPGPRGQEQSSRMPPV